MSAEIAAVLRRAAELIAEPERWCQGAIALSKSGFGCDENSPRAAQWCVIGAISHAAFLGDMVTHWIDAVHAFRRHNRICSSGDWNDRADRTHAEVLAALRAAAEAEERAP